MLSPDGTHVLVGSATKSTRKGVVGERVATYDLGDISNKGKGAHYVTDYDKMVKAGWKPLAALKMGEAKSGVFQTFHLDQWAKIEHGAGEVRRAAQRGAEQMESNIANSAEFGSKAVEADESSDGTKTRNTVVDEGKEDGREAPTNEDAHNLSGAEEISQVAGQRESLASSTHSHKGDGGATAGEYLQPPQI